jgi:hypothetical protein
VGADRNESEEVANERGRSIVTYLSEKWNIATERIELLPEQLQTREVVITLSAREPSPL